MRSTPQLTLPSASLSREEWRSGSKEFDRLFLHHGIEVRGKPFELDRVRIYNLQRQGRLVWIVARDDGYAEPIGYQLSFWYRNLHWNEIEATDDLWYVSPDWRRDGIGSALKRLAHYELGRHGAVRVFDNIREAAHARLMGELGYEPWGTRWVKKI
jgi:GNAT superfamily N-acetyltransferase